jgi:hypothetical protein
VFLDAGGGMSQLDPGALVRAYFMTHQEGELCAFLLAGVNQACCVPLAEFQVPNICCTQRVMHMEAALVVLKQYHTADVTNFRSDCTHINQLVLQGK